METAIRRSGWWPFGRSGRTLDEGRWARLDSFIAATRAAVFVRRVDNLLFIRPEKTLGINSTGADLVEALWNREGRGARESLQGLVPRLGAPLPRLLEDAEKLAAAISSMMRDDFSPREGVRFESFQAGRLRYPVLAEIALTYGCQNRCTFCYAASPHRAEARRAMSTAEVKRVMERIWTEAHAPSLSFTGGEATLRPDLAELVSHGKGLGFRVNLITNGCRASEPGYSASLVEAGLASAQVSIEAADEPLHDRLAGRRGAFAQTVAGIRNLAALGIHVHTNTTLCRENLEQAEELIRFVARDLGRKTLSMNMLIRTGTALEGAAPVTYTEICARLPRLLEVAKEEGLKFVWYSPIPYCLLNPVLVGQGAKSCSCVDGIVSVNPSGELLPCSSFNDGIGSLLEKGYDEIRASEAARYWHRRDYVPPPCKACPDVDVCAGACPLYWDAAGSFDELPGKGAPDSGARDAWERQRRAGGSFGVPAPCSSGRNIERRV